jgi:hypothetical protein
MSARELARAIKVPTTRITDILRGRRGITGHTALRLGRYLERARFLDEPAKAVRARYCAAGDRRAARRDSASPQQRSSTPDLAAVTRNCPSAVRRTPRRRLPGLPSRRGRAPAASAAGATVSCHENGGEKGSRFNGKIVIPGRSQRAGPGSHEHRLMNPSSEALVPGFRARGRRPRARNDPTK